MTYDSIIVGTGFSGLAAAIQLKKRGLDNFIILERADKVGGTWRDNDYPGAACDVPSHLYSFSFEPKADWTHKFARQEEILAYQQHCADKYGLMPHMRFNSAVDSADYAEGIWTVALTDGQTFQCRHFITAVGMLSQPAIPKINGVDNFTGDVFHSADWNHGLDLTGKNIAVIGTGASAIQFVPELAKVAANVTLFQRTAPWVMPKPDRAYSKKEIARFKRWPWLLKLSRFWIYWSYEYRVIGMRYFKAALKAYEWNAKRFIRKQLPNKEKVAKVTPNFPMGCKRILIANNYYTALAQDNVQINTDGVDEIAVDGVISNTGEHYPADIIVYGTGFQATNFLTPMTISCNEVDLNDAWKNGAEAYLGTTLAGFPNMYILYGPNVSLGHSSMIFMLEAQAKYATDLIETSLKTQKTYTVKPAVQAKFNNKIHKELDKTVWAQDCNSWYVDESGKNTTSWPGFTFNFRNKTKKLNLDDYDTV